MFVCVCEREREKERDRESKKERQRERRERVTEFGGGQADWGYLAMQMSGSSIISVLFGHDSMCNGRGWKLHFLIILYCYLNQRMRIGGDNEGRYRSSHS